MSIVGQVLGAGVGSAAEGIGNALDKLFTSDDERLSREEVLERIRQKPHEWQAEINKIEATHRTLLVAGWRPFIGWTCGVAVAWNFVIYELLIWFMAVFAPEVIPPPRLSDISALFTLLAAMLGLGGMRTAEKFKGVTR